MLYSEYVTILESLQNSGDEDSLEKHCKKTLQLAEEAHSIEAIMLAALCLLFLVRLSTVKNDYSKMRSHSKKLIRLLKKGTKAFPENVEFIAMLGIANGNIANKTPVCYFPVKMKHGFRGILYYKKASRMDERNKYVLICGIGHCFNAPKPMGGNPGKGVSLAKIHNQLYQYDEWVKYLLADGQKKVNPDESKRIIENMLARNPQSFFAGILKNEIDGI